MGVRETRLRRAVMSGIKLGISSAAVLATAAGWALFGAADQTGQTAQNSAMAQANVAPLVEQAAPQTETQDFFPRRRYDDDEHEFEGDDDEREFEGDDDSDEDRETAPVAPPAEPTAPQAIPVPSPSTGSQQVAPSQPAPRRPVTRTRSSR